jgi:hypothetical protein
MPEDNRAGSGDQRSEQVRAEGGKRQIADQVEATQSVHGPEG